MGQIVLVTPVALIYGTFSLTEHFRIKDIEIRER
jgi:hypothetical protein